MNEPHCRTPGTALVVSRPRQLMRAVLLGALASGAGIALLGTAAWLLSRAAERPPILYLMVAIVAVRAFGIGKGVLRYTERLDSHDLALRLQTVLRLDTWRALTQSTWVGRHGGDLLSRLVNDVEAIQDLVVRVIVPVASAGLVAVATTTVITLLSPGAGLLLAVSVALAGVVMPWLAARLAARSIASLAPLRGELATVAAEASDAAPDLVAYGATDAVVARLAAVDTRLRRAEQRAAWASGLAGFGQTLAAGVAVLGGLLVGAVQVFAGVLSPVNLAVVVLTPLALHEVLATLPAAALAWHRSHSALGRVGEVLTAPTVGSPDNLSVVATDTSEVPPSIEIADLSAGWPGSAPAVVGLDLTVQAGEKAALVGPSGTGKTTVAATLLGLLPPVAGTAQARGRLGYLAQDAYLFDTTVAENVRIGRRDAGDTDIAKALARARVSMPLDRLVGIHGTQVSGGEARRIALARLLLGNADVLILDEPTEHLDAPTAAALVDDLWATTTDSGAAVLVITHDPTLAARCDRVVSLPNPPVSGTNAGLNQLPAHDTPPLAG
ncbi:putative ABC transporter permease/ATP-binding protein CydC [Microlunatus phosphovorus NM-1]|uniref:Putative ABC transporter permease/ATP-binding protein CydC n=1 Tax=Microlunatus phosphovorus (strain ATCC 700054 / DSM 10555 / JCM 9379 / NBRC 101784 / NCIMB 13414 / VKM Ac-1990 / NM-1) TaxID=1032480 RepID=F5XFS1_MICPN|nr:thiol reductant ABC exporter subunit CydC [Microlunatus phosphovorus]BAK35478.1 putative ABC transporter permease/ATP-binding protein CydC [Microlunatus phosphovorus NM-1]